MVVLVLMVLTHTPVTVLLDSLGYTVRLVSVLRLGIQFTSFEMIATGNEWGDAYLYSPNDGTVYRVRGTNKKLVVE